MFSIDMMSKAMHVPHGTLDKLAHSRWYHCAVDVHLSCANLLSAIHHHLLPPYRIRLQGLLSVKLYSSFVSRSQIAFFCSSQRKWSGCTGLNCNRVNHFPKSFGRMHVLKSLLSKLASFQLPSSCCCPR